MKLSYLKPRPIHPKTDPATQEAFKKTWRNSTWLLICKGSATYCYTIFNSILALRVLICPNEVSFAPLEGILAGRRRASARRACVTGAGRV
jgi:hypothetical protein